LGKSRLEIGEVGVGVAETANDDGSGRGIGGFHSLDLELYSGAVRFGQSACRARIPSMSWNTCYEELDELLFLLKHKEHFEL